MDLINCSEKKFRKEKAEILCKINWPRMNYIRCIGASACEILNETLIQKLKMLIFSIYVSKCVGGNLSAKLETNSSLSDHNVTLQNLLVTFPEIVKEILKARPDFAWKKNLHGWTPLHLACSKGHLEITRELVKLDSDLCLIQDVEGRIPLHCAAIKGRINIIVEILSVSLEFFERTTYNGETILHLAVTNNQYEVVKYLTESLNTSKLLNMQDNDGNTILHLATAGKLTAVR